MKAYTGPVFAFDTCDPLIYDLDALEQAIMEICPFEMQVKISARKKEIKEAMK